MLSHSSFPSLGCHVLHTDITAFCMQKRGNFYSSHHFLYGCYISVYSSFKRFAFEHAQPITISGKHMHVMNVPGPKHAHTLLCPSKLPYLSLSSCHLEKTRERSSNFNLFRKTHLNQSHKNTSTIVSRRIAFQQRSLCEKAFTGGSLLVSPLAVPSTTSWASFTAQECLLGRCLHASLHCLQSRTSPPDSDLHKHE